MDSTTIYYLNSIGLLLFAILVFSIYRAVKLIVKRSKEAKEEEGCVSYFHKEEYKNILSNERN